MYVCTEKTHQRKEDTDSEQHHDKVIIINILNISLSTNSI